MSIGTNWLATVRGRIGYLVTPTALLYFTGGVAFADVDYAASANNAPDLCFIDIVSRTVPGYVLGAGLNGRWVIGRSGRLPVSSLFPAPRSQFLLLIPSPFLPGRLFLERTDPHGSRRRSYKF
jgi:hypothetical protein